MKVHLLLLMAIISSCLDDEVKTVFDENGIIVSKPFHNLAILTDDENHLAILGIANNAKFRRGAILSGVNNENRTLKMIDIDTGDELWEWYDPINYTNYDVIHRYINGQYLIWDEGRELFCVDMSSGETVWKERFGNNNSPLFRSTNGMGNSIFTMAIFPYNYSPLNPSSARVYKTSVSNGPELEDVLQISHGDYVDSDGISTSPGEIGIFLSNDGDTLIFLDTIVPFDDIVNGQSHVNLYNLNTKQWAYEKKVIEGVYSYNIHKPKLYNGIVYLAMSPNILAIDLMTGEEVWRWHRPHAGHGTSGFILVPEKDLIIFNAETSSTTLYALDLATGTQVWSEPSSGTSSRLQYLNGVVYWVGGGDGLLHAVDVDTGETLWKIRSPDEAQNSRAFFTRYCAAFPGVNGEKGKIVVSSGLHAFAYEEAEQ